MKLFVLFLFAFLFGAFRMSAQSNNAQSVYEGERIQSVLFAYGYQPADSLKAVRQKQLVEEAFLVYPYTHFNEFQVTYYMSQIKNLPFVEEASYHLVPQGDGSYDLQVSVRLSGEDETTSRRANLFEDIKAFPVIYSGPHSLLTFKMSASEMAYSNNNAWFARPAPLLDGNPLAENPVGKGYTAWLEGFAMGGIYGIVRIVPKWNFHLYGGAGYILSFSAGRELFTDKSRFHGEVEDAFAGFIGGKRLAEDHEYAYSVLYGRKQFVLGNGWLIINTSMNGQERAGLQINLLKQRPMSVGMRCIRVEPANSGCRGRICIRSYRTPMKCRICCNWSIRPYPSCRRSPSSGLLWLRRAITWVAILDCRL